MSILHSISLRIKSNQAELLTAQFSLFDEFSGVQENSGDQNALFQPPQGYEVLEFGSEAARKFDDYCTQQLDKNLSEEVSVSFFFEVKKEFFSSLKERVTSCLLAQNIEPLAEWKEIQSQDYLKNYQEAAEPSVFGDFWVGAPWKEPLESQKYRYFIEPGMAFGTGEHPTTQMCLTRLQELFAADESIGSFLDLGTGSGLLALHACRLFPEAKAWACDLDPHCELEFAKTFRLNDQNLQGVTQCFGSEAKIEQMGLDLASLDLLISNIYSEVLATLVVDARKLLKPGAPWIISGVLEGGPEQVLLKAAAKHFELSGRWTQSSSDERDTWVSLVLR